MGNYNEDINAKFAEHLKKLDYEVTVENGAVMVVGKSKKFEDDLKTMKKIVADFGYNHSWGIRGGVTTAKPVDTVKPVVEETDIDTESENTDIADVSTSSGDFEQMNLLDFM